MSTQGRANVDKLLTNVSNQLVPQGYISEMVLPEVKVKQRSGKVGKYGKGHLRIVSSLVIGKADYPTVDVTTRSDSSYYIEEHALKELVTQTDKDNIVITEPIPIPYNRQELETRLRLEEKRRDRILAEIAKIKSVLSNFK